MYYSNLQRIIILGACFAVANCTTDVANRYYAAKKYPEKNVSEVELLSARPKRDFEAIADFQSRNESRESLRKRAAKIGADAVIVTSLGGFYSFSDQWVNSDSQTDTGSRMVATAIKYK